MVEVLRCTPNALHNLGPGRSIVFLVGPDLDVAAKNDPVIRELRDIVEKLLRSGTAVYQRRPVPDHPEPHFCEHTLILKRVP